MRDFEDTQEQYPDRSPGIGLALLLFLLLVVGQVLVATLLSSLEMAGARLDRTTTALLTTVLVYPPILWIGVRVAKRPWSECYPLRPFRVSIVAPVPLVSVGAAILILEALSWVPIPEAYSKVFHEALAGNRVSELLLVILVGPVFEELFFRGWVLRSFLCRYSVRTSVLMSALLFAAGHVDPWYAMIVFPLGIFFAWLVLKTGSLVPSVVGHVTVNAISRVWPALLSFLGYDSEKIREAGHFPLAVLGVALLLTVAGAAVLSRAVAEEGETA